MQDRRTKPSRIDPIAGLLKQRRTQPQAAFSADEIDELLGHFSALQKQIATQGDMIESLQSTSAADPVTGLANATTLRLEIERSLATATRYGRRHGLIKLIIDDFDGFDALGADVAVAALTHMARLMRQGIRATDIAARAHKAEFYVILNELKMLENAETRATELAAAVAQTPCVMGTHTLSMTITTGACLFGAEDTLAEIMARVAAAWGTSSPRNA